MADESFKALLTKVRAGDQVAAAQMVRTYQPVIERIVRLRLGDRVRRAYAVSDVMQSVMGSFFIRAALGQYELESPEDLLKLLSVMARNKAADKARGVPDKIADQPVDEIDVPSPGASLSREIHIRSLAERAREKLAPDVRELAELRAQGFEWTEIADKLGGSAEALRKKLTRAVDDVAAELGVDSL